VKAPAFQLYARDWLANVKLRRCSPAARGAWIDVMCLMHGSDEYGVLRWPLVDIARTVNVPIKVLRELVDRDVLKGADQGATDYTHTPRHAGKDLEPVTLLVAGSGPVWYCSRFLRDEWVRSRRGGDTRFGTDNQPSNRQPNGPVGTPPDKPPTGKPTRRLGDGPAFASATAVKTYSEANASGAEAPASPVDKIFGFGIPLLTAAGVSDRNARSMLGLMRKKHGDEAVCAALDRCAEEQPLQPVAWLQKALAVANERTPQRGETARQRETREIMESIGASNVSDSGTGNGRVIDSTADRVD